MLNSVVDLWERACPRIGPKGLHSCHYLTTTLPFIIEMWPGKVQKKL